MNKIDVTVVVCTYNRANFLLGILDSLFKQETKGELNFEIVVINNASTDETEEVLQQLANDATVPMRTFIESSQGVVFARNRGIAEASGDYIYFIDDDETAAPNCVLNMYRFLETRQIRVGGGAVRVRLPDSCPADQRELYESILSPLEESEQAFRYQSRSAPGAGNLMLHRTVFDEVGLFDENLVEAAEDTELFNRIDQAGIEAWFCPDATVLHLMDDYRVSIPYVRWLSIRHGWNRAREDYRGRGNAYVIVNCLARLAHMSVVAIPKWLITKISGRSAASTMAMCRVWRTTAYTRNTLRQLAPTVFPQEKFFQQLDFRGEREMFGTVNYQTSSKDITTV